jgi:hypothetical protein
MSTTIRCRDSGSIRIHASEHLSLTEITISDAIGRTFASIWADRIELIELRKAITAILFPLERDKHPAPVVRRVARGGS